MIFPSPCRLIDLVGSNCNIEGDKNVLITGLGVVNKIKNGDLCFAENEPILQKLLQSDCCAIITKKHLLSAQKITSSSKTFIITDNPSKLFASIISKIGEAQYKDIIYFPLNPKYITSKSTVAADAFLPENLELGNNCVIYPQVYIDKGVKLGHSVILMPGVKIFAGTTLGNDVLVHSNAVIGNSPNWHYKDNDIYNDLIGIGGVIIGNNVFIGANVSIDKGLIENTIIENNVKIGNNVQVGHGVHIQENVLVVAQAGIAGGAFIGRNSIISGQSAVNSNIKIASNTKVFGKSAVTKDINESNLRLFGIPAEEITSFNQKKSALNRLPRLLKNNDAFKIKKELRETIAQIIFDQLGVEKEKLNTKFNFKEDGGADSLDFVEFIMAIEEEYGLTISEDEADKILTLKDLYKYLLKHGIKPEEKGKKT